MINVSIKKEDFVKAMGSIKKQTEIDDKNSDAFSIILPEDFITRTENVLYDEVIGIWEKLTNDTSKWIEYFIYELNFGKENHRLKVYEKDGVTEIPLANINDLWTILMREE